MVESDIVLLYIWSHVRRIIYAVGPRVATVQTPYRNFSCDIWRRKVLNIAIDEVSAALSMHAAPRPYGLFVVPVGVTVLLGLHNLPCSWTGMVGPSLPGFTIAPCVDSLLCYRSIRRLLVLIKHLFHVPSC
jgi:hypothetical protein